MFEMLVTLLAEAWKSLRANARRSTLTMLGIAWGIATVVLLLAYGKGLEMSVVAAFESFGTKVIFVGGGRTSMQAGGEKAGRRILLELDDMEYLRASVPLVRNYSPEVSANFQVAYGARSQEFEVNGVYPVYGAMRRMQIGEGRWLTPGDELEHARVAVIGWEVRRRLFSERPAVGETIRIFGQPFDVIGVLVKKVQIDDSPDNRAVFLPFATMKFVRDTRYLGSIVIEAENAGANTQVIEQVRARLAERHRFLPQDRRALWVWSILEEIEEVRIITGALKVLLAVIGALTLAIGGVGVMNIMLVSVTQRTREIGTQKSLGARRRHIMTQFLAEALLITMVGGVLGIVMSYTLVWVLGPLPLWSAFYGEDVGDADIVLRISWQTLLIASGILSVVGLAAGMWPAMRASRLDPVEALRYE